MGKSKVTFTSNFDAGNMARCEQMESMNHVSTNIFYLLYSQRYSLTYGWAQIPCHTTNILGLGKFWSILVIHYVI